MKNRKYFVLILPAIVIFFAAVYFGSKFRIDTAVHEFSGQAALSSAEYQLSLGPRTAGSPAHAAVVDYFLTELKDSGWDASLQETTFGGQAVRNIIAKRGNGTPWTIIGAHYDSRMAADQDPDPAKRDQPVPGANDGASGAAVLIELAASVPKKINGQIWLVFFDFEDNGSLPGWDWILGSRAFVAELEGKPDAAVIVDMIGDTALNIYMESNSNPELTRQIWDEASTAGYREQFIPQYKFSMLDDHTPFLEAGIQAVDIIDFDYPYWHTTADTMDKISAKSLEAVGVTLQNWLAGRHNR